MTKKPAIPVVGSAAVLTLALFNTFAASAEERTDAAASVSSTEVTATPYQGAADSERPDVPADAVPVQKVTTPPMSAPPMPGIPPATPPVPKTPAPVTPVPADKP